jgi:NTE family protein
LFVDEDKVANYLISSGEVGIDVGTNLGTWGQLRTGAVWSKVFARVDTGSPILPTVRETTAGLRAALFIDQTNTAWFPTDGYGFIGTAYAAMTSFGSAVNYQRLEGNARGIRSWGDNVLNLAVSGGTALGSDMPAYESFALGGPSAAIGIPHQRVRGPRLCVWPPDVLPPHLFAAGHPGVGASTSAPREKSAYIPIASTTRRPGNAVVRIDVSRCGYVPWARISGLGYGGAGNWSLYMLLGAP